MKKIIIEHNGRDNEYNLPESWSDVTVKQFSELQSIKKGMTQLEEIVEVISIMLNIDKSIILKMKSSSLKDINNQIEFYVDTNKLKETAKDSILINGEEYFFVSDIVDFSVAEEISVNVLIEKYENDITRGLAEFLCIFLRKKIDGKLEEFDPSFISRAGMFEKLSIQDVFSHFLFFSKVEKK